MANLFLINQSGHNLEKKEKKMEERTEFREAWMKAKFEKRSRIWSQDLQYYVRSTKAARVQIIGNLPRKS